MKSRFLSFVIILICSATYAQQDAQFTQYMYNTIVINPAYAGSRNSMNVFALHRSQWVGLDGAPETQAASINTPFNESNVGLGVSLIKDKIGPGDELNVAIDLAYSVQASENYKLSLGMKATANWLNIDFMKLNARDRADYTYSENIDNKFSPNIGLGLYLHSDKTYFGISIPSILATKHFNDYINKGSSSNVAKESVNFYMIAGKVFDLDGNVKFKPSILAKYVAGAPFQADVSANFMFNEKFVVGAAYRWSAAASFMAGFQISNAWFLGYSYDMETTPLAKYNSGSHEFFLRFELFKKYDKIISPRFF